MSNSRDPSQVSAPKLCRRYRTPKYSSASWWILFEEATAAGRYGLLSSTYPRPLCELDFIQNLVSVMYQSHRAECHDRRAPRRCHPGLYAPRHLPKRACGGQTCQRSSHKGTVEEGLLTLDSAVNTILPMIGMKMRVIARQQRPSRQIVATAVTTQCGRIAGGQKND